jgi:hypothetical protein
MELVEDQNISASEIKKMAVELLTLRKEKADRENYVTTHWPDCGRNSHPKHHGCSLQLIGRQDRELKALCWQPITLEVTLYGGLEIRRWSSEREGWIVREVVGLENLLECLAAGFIDFRPISDRSII